LCLPNVDNYEYLRNIRIPESVYSSARGNLPKMQRSVGPDEPDHRRSHSADHPGWVSPSWSQSSSPHYTESSDRPLSPSSTCSSPIQNAPIYSPAIPHRSPSTPRPREVHADLPRLSTIAPHLPLPHPPHRRAGVTSAYSPLTSEDQRALNSFRVVL